MYPPPVAAGGVLPSPGVGFDPFLVSLKTLSSHPSSPFPELIVLIVYFLEGCDSRRKDIGLRSLRVPRALQTFMLTRGVCFIWFGFLQTGEGRGLPHGHLSFLEPRVGR